MEVDKDFLLTKSKTFCMFPWIHLNVTPYGDVYPCCSSDYTNKFGNVKDDTLKSIFNNTKMKNLRLDMLNNKENKICDFCYKHEKSSPFSFRNYSLENFSKYFDEVVTKTKEDGEVSDFKMKYYDVRFSNVCNFKCRTCGEEFSSQWAQEIADTQNKKDSIILHHADSSGRLLDEIKEQVYYIDFAYFVGGEPLIMDEHYVILEEMIKIGRSKEIVLRYNTNMSNFRFKKRNVFDLWQNFKKVELSASLDHYGEKAEYIRHGTNWGIIEDNIKKVRSLDYIEYQFNTVLSVFNYLTISDFFYYLIEHDLLKKKDYISIYRALFPKYFSAQALPKNLKEKGNTDAYFLYNFLQKNDWYQAIHVDYAIKFTNENDSWNENKKDFNNNIKHIDKIRNENFVRVFPELADMLE